MGRSKEQWEALAEKRIFNIVGKHRVTSTRHLEIKISEAGPANQRVEPAILNSVFKKLKKDGKLPIKSKNPEVVGAHDFGKPGDAAKLGKFLRLHDVFIDCSQRNELCGLQLESLLYRSLLADLDQYMVVGTGPIKDATGRLYKPNGAEVIHFNGKMVYAGESGAGFDLFAIHRDSGIPIGIEAKNIREWIYPASVEVWRMIARAVTLDCLPVLAARKISYITTAGLFARVGVMGFQTQFQYFNPTVRAHSKYQFKDVVDKDGLGFADIKITDDVPKHFNHFFKNILPPNIEEYHKRFLAHKDILKKYAIDLGMAEDKMNQGKRYGLYLEFKKEIDFEDPSLYDEPDQMTVS